MTKPFNDNLELGALRPAVYDGGDDTFFSKAPTLRKRAMKFYVAGFVVVIFMLWPMSKLLNVGSEYENTAPALRTGISSQRTLQIILPATNPDVNLCKTIATLTALGYSTPSIVGWEQIYNRPEMMSGGSHLGKITNTLAYLESLDPKDDDSLVLVMDAYDIWFQLPPSVMIERYERLTQEGTARLGKRIGGGGAGLKESIIFAAGKRCAPNQAHTIACYAVPEAPIPKDLYGVNTDTVMGRNKYFSGRQRFLNSGYAIGPVADMRRLFRHASTFLTEHEEHDPDDNGSHGSDFLYHGSDQSIFNKIFGQQEYMRELLRRRQTNVFQRTWRALTGAEQRARAGPDLEGTPVKDVLNPSFTHEEMSINPDVNYEYGIGLDYTSDLGHQTVNSEVDAEWLLHDRALTPQIQPRLKFDCPVRATQELPEDLASGLQPHQVPLANGSNGASTDFTWADVSLYTHLCYDTIPVMIHHNGLKDARARLWDRLWFETDAMRSLGSTQQRDVATEATGAARHIELADGGRSGAWTDAKGSISWDELCPGFS